MTPRTAVPAGRVAPADPLGPAVRVVVAIPAREEAHVLGDCLDSVAAAVDHARAVGLVTAAVVVVAAHRSTDGTAAVARSRFDRPAGVTGEAGPTAGLTGVVLRDDHSPTVADVRRAAVAVGLAALAAPDAHAGPEAHVQPPASVAPAEVPDGARTWILSTDADSTVPADWITGLIGAARTEGAVGAAGLVKVTDWDADPAAQREYARIVARGIHGSTHDHVYGANLAVRLDAYLAVDGFPARVHGEDHALVRALRGSGHRVATPLTPVVRTSGRADARCAQGLGSLLRSLARPAAGAVAGAPARAQRPTLRA